MITIVSIRTIYEDDIATGQHAEIIITDGVDSYAWRVGGIPLAVDVQAYLDAIEAELWPVAEAAAEPVEDRTIARLEARQFLADNPNAQLLLDLSPADLETAIETRNADGETLLLKTLAFAVRYLNELIK